MFPEQIVFIRECYTQSKKFDRVKYNKVENQVLYEISLAESKYKREYSVWLNEESDTFFNIGGNELTKLMITGKTKFENVFCNPYKTIFINIGVYVEKPYEIGTDIYKIAEQKGWDKPRPAQCCQVDDQYKLVKIENKGYSIPALFSPANNNLMFLNDNGNPFKKVPIKDRVFKEIPKKEWIELFWETPKPKEQQSGRTNR